MYVKCVCSVRSVCSKLCVVCSVCSVCAVCCVLCVVCVVRSVCLVCSVCSVCSECTVCCYIPICKFDKMQQGREHTSDNGRTVQFEMHGIQLFSDLHYASWKDRRIIGFGGREGSSNCYDAVAFFTLLIHMQWFTVHHIVA